MENATKALLIAATILIVIMLVSLDIALVKNASNTTKQADEMENLLKESTKFASGEARGAIKGIIITRERFNDFLDKFSAEHPDSYQNTGRGLTAILEEIKTKNLKLKDQIELSGYIYMNQSNDKNLKIVHAGLERKEGQTDNEYFEQTIKFCIQNGEPISDPTDTELIKSLLWNKYLKKSMGVYSKEKYEASEIKMPTTWFFHYDDTRYIDKISFLAYIHPYFASKIGE